MTDRQARARAHTQLTERKPVTEVPWAGLSSISVLCGRPYALGGLIATLTMFTFHSYVWSKLHRAQHDLEDNWTCRLPWFAELKRHHLDHHIRPSRNFAALFLWTDRLFGTYWRSPEAGSATCDARPA